MIIDQVAVRIPLHADGTAPRIEVDKANTAFHKASGLGACGDVTEVDNLNPNRQPGGEDWARLVGGGVGAAASKVLTRCPGAHCRRWIPLPKYCVFAAAFPIRSA